jgi:hypothetical protein
VARDELEVAGKHVPGAAHPAAPVYPHHERERPGRRRRAEHVQHHVILRAVPFAGELDHARGRMFFELLRELRPARGERPADEQRRRTGGHDQAGPHRDIRAPPQYLLPRAPAGCRRRPERIADWLR